MKTKFKYSALILITLMFVLSTIPATSKKSNKFNFIPQNFPLQLIEPNGNEIYSSGMDTIIRWKGVSPNEIFKLEYSIDKGNNWNFITDTAKDLSYNWKVPNISSDNCLMKISNVSQNKNSLDSNVVFGYGELRASDISPDGNYIATRSKNGLLIIWDVGTKRVIKKIYLESIYPELLSWSSKDRIAIASGINNIKIVDLKIDSIYEINTGLDGKLTTIAWNPDGEQIACGDITGKITVVNTYLRNISKILDSYSFTVRSISWSPLGIDLLSGHGDGAILLWNLTHTIPSFTVLGYHNGLASAVAWSPKGDLIASGGVDQRIIIQDLQGNIIKSLSAHKGRINVLDWNKTGTQLISGSDDNIVKRWSNSGIELAEYHYYHKQILSVKWDINNYEFLTASADNNLFMISAVNDTITRSFEGYSNSIQSLSWDPANADYVASASNNYKFYLWNIRTKQVIRTFVQNDSTINSIAFNPLGNEIAIGLDNGNISLFNSNNGKFIRMIDYHNKHKKKINSLVWTSAGEIIISCSDDNTIKTWDKNTGNMIDDINPQSGAVLSMDIKPMSNYIACGFADNSVKIYDLTDMQIVRPLNLHKDSIISVKWNFSGDTLAVMSADGQISLWNTSKIYDIKFIKTFSTNANSSLLSWNPVSNILASAGDFEGSYLWDNSYGLVMKNYPVQFDNLISSVQSVQWDFSGHRLLTACDDGILSLLYFNSMPSLIQTDISDNIWKIESPNFISKDIDMGTVEVGSDSTIDSYGFLVNLSKIPVRIDSIVFRGSDIDNFDFNVPATPITLQSYAVKSATFTFHPLSVGNKTCDIIIYSQNDTLYQKITGIGIQKNIIIYSVDFGNVQIGNQKDTNAVVIKNIGNKILRLKKITKTGKDSSAFNVSYSYSLPLDLLVNQEYTFDLTFIPDKIGMQTCNIEFSIDGIPNNYIAKLSGRGITMKPVIQIQNNDSLHLICNHNILDTINISNAGELPLIISSIDWSSNDNSAFSIIKSLENIPIDSSETKQMIIAFTPKKAGIYKSKLQITSNSYKDSILTIYIVGIKDSINLDIDNSDFYFPDVCIGDTINGEITLENTGNVAFNLNINSDSQNVNLSDDKYFLDTNQSNVLDFSIINTGNLPIEDYQIYIQDDLCGQIDTINIQVSTIKVDLEVSDFEISTKVGAFIDSSITVTNLSDSDIKIDSIIIDNNKFKVLGFQSGLILKSDEKKEVEFRFSPTNYDTIKSIVRILGQPCNFTKSFTATGLPLLSRVIISIDSVKAKSGKIIEIPIRINFPENIDIPDTIELKTLLSFNKNLLYPLSDNKGYILDDKRFMWLDVFANLKQSGIITKLTFRTMLGDEESTILTLDSISTIKGFLKFTQNSGLFTLADVCHQGGDRLIVKSGELSLMQNLPNPAKNITIINYYLNEEGNYELSLYNSLGNKIKTISRGYGLIGEYKKKLDVSKYSDGTYFYILRSQTRAISKLLTVIK